MTLGVQLTTLHVEYLPKKKPAHLAMAGFF